jgi:type II secretory pathway component GspD/PulD (secretin)
MNIRRLGVILLLLVHLPALAQEMAVIELRHRPADEMIPLIQPFLGPHDSVVPHRTQLIIKAERGTIDEVRSLLEKVDQRAHRLQISVIQGKHLPTEGLNGGIAVGGRVGGGVNVRGGIAATQQQGTNQATQHVQTLDGQAATIQVGQVVPYATYGYGYGGVNYLPVTTGFSVIPRLTGPKEALIAIEPWSDHLNRGGIIKTQVASTQLRAPMGVWVEVGGLTKTRTNQGFGVGYSNSQQDSRIFLKVDDLDAGQP